VTALLLSPDEEELLVKDMETAREVEALLAGLGKEEVRHKDELERAERIRRVD
jgi:hypothetical protein